MLRANFDVDYNMYPCIIGTIDAERKEAIYVPFNIFVGLIEDDLIQKKSSCLITILSS